MSRLLHSLSARISKKFKILLLLIPQKSGNSMPPGVCDIALVAPFHTVHSHRRDFLNTPWALHCVSTGTMLVFNFPGSTSYLAFVLVLEAFHGVSSPQTYMQFCMNVSLYPHYLERSFLHCSKFSLQLAPTAICSKSQVMTTLCCITMHCTFTEAP